MFSDVLSCFPMFSAGLQLLCITTPCADIFSQDDVRCFQMFQRCFQMFQRCFQMFSAVFRCSQDAPNWSQIFYTDFQICSRSAQLFSNIHRCFQMITKVFLKRHFERKKKPNPVRNWGGLGRIYPEGEGNLTSLGGRQRHLKFGKNWLRIGGGGSGVIVHSKAAAGAW